MAPKRTAASVAYAPPAKKPCTPDERAAIEAEIDLLEETLRSGSGSHVDLERAVQKLRQLAGQLEVARTLTALHATRVLAVGVDPTDMPLKWDEGGILAAATCWRSFLQMLRELGLDAQDAGTLMRGWPKPTNVSDDGNLKQTPLRASAKRLLARLVKEAESAKAAGGPELRVLGLGRLMDMLLQVQFDASRAFDPNGTYAERRFTTSGDCLCGVEHTDPPPPGTPFKYGKKDHYISPNMLEATGRGRNIRRVYIKRGGAVVASFYLAVFVHPGSKKRADTAADIEVPAQLLRDLFDGVTHMDALEIDADAL